MNSAADIRARTGFCIYRDVAFEGSVPAVRNEVGQAFVFATECEAQQEIAANMVTRLLQFIEGERSFEEALVKDEYIVKVSILPDGSVVTLNGTRFW